MATFNALKEKDYLEIIEKDRKDGYEVVCVGLHEIIMRKSPNEKNDYGVQVSRPCFYF